MRRIAASSSAPTMSRVRSLSLRCRVTTSEVANNSSLVTARTPSSSGVLGLQVLAPGDDVHAEGEADLGDLAAELAQADDPEPRTRELEAERALPTAVADVAVFSTDVPREGEDQAPGQLGRRHPQAGRSPHLDAQLATGVEVDRRVRHPRRDEQLEAGRVGQHPAGERRPFTHRDHDVGVAATRPPDASPSRCSVCTSRSNGAPATADNCCHGPS